MKRGRERFHWEAGKLWVGQLFKKNIVGLGSESRKLSGVSTSELLKLDMASQTV